MKLTVTVSEEDVKRLIAAKLNAVLDDDTPDIQPADVQLLVKSKNNYKPQEWEVGVVQVIVNREI